MGKLAKIFTAAIAALITVFCISIISEVQAQISPEPTEEIRLPGTFSISELEFDSDGNMFVADPVDNNVKIYDPAGELLETIGREGEGPGEFDSPGRIDLSPDEQLMVVTDNQRRISFFERDGRFSHSFTLPLHQGTAFGGTSFLSDSLVLVARILEDRETFESRKLHTFTLEGDSVNAFYPYVETLREYDGHFQSLARAFVDSETKQIYAVQPGEYSVSVFSRDGKEIDFLQPNPLPEHYQGITSSMPEGFGRSSERVVWGNSFDRVEQAVPVNDTLLAIEVRKLDDELEYGYGHHQIDFLYRSTGELVHSLRVDPISSVLILHARNERLYLAGPTPEEPVGIVQVYPVETLLEIDHLVLE
jgi:hypothetical protein